MSHFAARCICTWLYLTHYVLWNMLSAYLWFICQAYFNFVLWLFKLRFLLLSWSQGVGWWSYSVGVWSIYEIAWTWPCPSPCLVVVSLSFSQTVIVLMSLQIFFSNSFRLFPFYVAYANCLYVAIFCSILIFNEYSVQLKVHLHLNCI